jgi:hypothetical protein
MSILVTGGAGYIGSHMVASSPYCGYQGRRLPRGAIYHPFRCFGHRARGGSHPLSSDRRCRRRPLRVRQHRPGHGPRPHTLRWCRGATVATQPASGISQAISGHPAGDASLPVGQLLRGVCRMSVSPKQKCTCREFPANRENNREFHCSSTRPTQKCFKFIGLAGWAGCETGNFQSSE